MEKRCVARNYVERRRGGEKAENVVEEEIRREVLVEDAVEEAQLADGLAAWQLGRAAAGVTFQKASTELRREDEGCRSGSKRQLAMS